MYKILISLLIFSFLNSCLKKQDLDEQDLGPAISSDEIRGKMGESIGNLYYDDIRKNEISSFTAVTIFEESQTTKRYKQELFVTDVTPTAQSLTINFLFNKQDYVNSQSSLSNQPYSMVINGNGATPSSPDLSGHVAKDIRAQIKADSPVPFFLYRAYVYFAAQGCREEKVSCHNLKIDSFKMYVPPEIASPRVCPNVDECLIDAKTVEFDMLDAGIPTDDGKPYRMHYSFKVSESLPFLSKVLQYCARGLTDYGGRKVLAEDCMTVNDFSYGQEP